MAEGKWRETVGHGFGTGRHKGGTKTWNVTNEDTGKVGGTQTEHWDDRVDANVHPDGLRIGLSVQGGRKKDDDGRAG